MQRTTISLRERKHPRRRIPRREGIIDNLRPLTFQAAADLDLDVESVHLFPEQNGIALGFTTGRGSINVLLPRQLASDLGDGLSWLVQQKSNV